MSAAQQVIGTQFLSQSLSGLNQTASTVHSIAQNLPQPEVRTDFSNLFQSLSSGPTVSTAGPNASALAIAAAKAKDLLRAKRLTDALKTVSNGNSVTSNGGNESSRDGEYLLVSDYLKIH